MEWRRLLCVFVALETTILSPGASYSSPTSPPQLSSPSTSPPQLSSPSTSPPQLSSPSTSPPQLSSSSTSPPQLSSPSTSPPQLSSPSTSPPQLSSPSTSPPQLSLPSTSPPQLSSALNTNTSLASSSSHSHKGDSASSLTTLPPVVNTGDLQLPKSSQTVENSRSLKALTGENIYHRGINVSLLSSSPSYPEVLSSLRGTRVTGSNLKCPACEDGFSDQMGPNVLMGPKS
ncbi:putative protein TPRXL [Homarus americanus]|uniref:putative protein TPRXL n=1 Tax=Homarus americanus TaxID=6706 RepID=UPI001C43A154|nr:putative protein TPRXL [Homarus americanus]